MWPRAPSSPPPPSLPLLSSPLLPLRTLRGLKKYLFTKSLQIEDMDNMQKPASGFPTENKSLNFTKKL